MSGEVARQVIGFHELMVEARYVKVGDWIQVGQRWFRVTKVDDWAGGEWIDLRSDGDGQFDVRCNEGVLVRRDLCQKPEP